jgi:CRISPR/Cas system CSM-associated protein Csm3 (group 7 of RAMP superfamily)
MFAHRLNQIRIDLSLSPASPLLIRSGRTSFDPTRPDLECVRTWWEGSPSVYVPGSSLKGVMRSHAERLLLTEGLRIVPTFDKRDDLNQRTPGDVAYRRTCPLGRTFGTVHLKGHVGVFDLLPGAFDPPGSPERAREVERANSTEQRNGVAIDRLLGAAAGKALFDQELVVQGRFDGSVFLRNVQLYQLALVLLAIRDLDEGYVQLGSGTTRGNGRVHAAVRGLTIETRAGHSPAGRLPGAGALAPNAETYDLFGNDEMALPAGIAGSRRLLWDRVNVPPERLEEFAEALVGGPWTAFLGAAAEKRWN